MVLDLTPLLDDRVKEIPVEEDIPLDVLFRGGDELQFRVRRDECVAAEVLPSWKERGGR